MSSVYCTEKSWPESMSAEEIIHEKGMVIIGDLDDNNILVRSSTEDNLIFYLFHICWRTGEMVEKYELFTIDIFDYLKGVTPDMVS